MTNPTHDSAKPTPSDPNDQPPRVLITAGPTHEPIDEVRYIANRSSGRMGLALAEESASRGYHTTLLLGPTRLLPESTGVAVHRFQTTAVLQELLSVHWPMHDLLIMAAAVADYRMPRSSQAAKVTRSAEGLTLHLESTPDLVAGLAETTRPDQRIVGFALEPADRLMTSAAAKLERKRLHAIVANPIETMESDMVEATLLLADGSTRRPSDSAQPGITKAEFASWLFDQLK